MTPLDFLFTGALGILGGIGVVVVGKHVRIQLEYRRQKRAVRLLKKKHQDDATFRVIKRIVDNITR